VTTPEESPLAADLSEVIHKAAAKRPLKRDPGVNLRKKRTDEKEQAKVALLGHLRQGKNIKQAADAVGRSEKTVYEWRYQSTKFRLAMDAAMEAFERGRDREQMSWRAQRDEIIPIVREDYPSWATYVAAFRKQYFNFDTFDHQWKMYEAMENAPGGGVTMILLPPAWAKTTTVCDASIADLCANPNFRNAFISGNLEFARKTLARVTRRLEGDGGPPSPLIEHFGPFKPEGVRSKKWNSDEITLLASDHDEQDPSVVSIGIKGRMRGYRWDRVYLDDIQDLNSLGETQKFIELFRQDVLTRPNKQGKIIIFGNRVGRGDFYEEMLRLDLVDELVVIPALDLSRPVGRQSNFPRQFRDSTGNVTTNPDLAVEPITDESGDQMGWDDEDLAKRRLAVGEDQWSRVYMMEPESDYSAMLSPEDIAEATDVNRKVGAASERAVAVMCSLDPSLHAHAFIIAAGYDSRCMYVYDAIDRFKVTTNQRLFAEVAEATRRYHPNLWVIENNTLQSGYLTDDAFLSLRDLYGFRAIGHHTGGEKKDAVLGVPAMMEAIRRGEIRFPRISEEHEGFQRLFDQLMSWRPDKPTKMIVQDGVMALWFAYLLWKRQRDAIVAEANPIRRQGLQNATLYPWARTNLRTPEPVGVSAAPETYEQMWDRIREPA
jgi:transposase